MPKITKPTRLVEISDDNFKVLFEAQKKSGDGKRFVFQICEVQGDYKGFVAGQRCMTLEFYPYEDHEDMSGITWPLSNEDSLKIITAIEGVTQAPQS